MSDTSTEEWICIECGTEVDAGVENCPNCGASSDPLIGKILANKYKLLRKLAGGGMGYVYLAEHIRLKYKKLRAIKILKDNLLHDNVLRKRFLREVELTHLVSQDNPHIVHIHDDYGFEKGIGFYVMEFLEGDTLEERIRHAPHGAPFGWSRDIALQICNALKSIHQADIVHRDLKPANIFLVEAKDGSDFVKVMDFGIAKAEHAGTQHTQEGAIIGTAQYLAPEQIRSLPGTRLDERCDIYALGCILFELLTGRPPFVLETLQKGSGEEEVFPLAFQNLVLQHLTETPPALRSFRPDAPEALEALVLQMLHKQPEARPSSVEEISDRLMRIEVPRDDFTLERGPSKGSLGTAQTVSSQEVSAEVLAQTSVDVKQTPPPSWSGSSPSTPMGPPSGTPASQASSRPSSQRSTDHLDRDQLVSRLDEEASAKSPSRMLWAVLALCLLSVGGGGSYWWYSTAAVTPPHKRPDPGLAAKVPKAPPPTRAPQPRPKKAPTPPAKKALKAPAKKAVKAPPIRRPRRTKPRRARRSAWVKIPLRMPRGFLRKYRLVASPRGVVKVRSKALWIKRSRRARLTLRARRNPLGYYTCITRISSKTRRLQLKPLLVDGGLAPDSKSYCFAR